MGGTRWNEFFFPVPDFKCIQWLLFGATSRPEKIIPIRTRWCYTCAPNQCQASALPPHDRLHISSTFQDVIFLVLFSNFFVAPTHREMETHAIGES